MKEIKKEGEEKNVKKSDETKQENVKENKVVKATKMVRIKENLEDRVDEGQEVKSESPEGDEVHIFL